MSETMRATAIAVVAHKGQVDKSGQPYIGHPQRVAARVEHLGDDAVAAALLHDVVEDTDVSLDDLRDAGVPYDIRQMVEGLTRRDGEPPEAYYRRIRIMTHTARQTTMAIKYADIADNTDPRRLALLDDATIVRLIRKYAKALDLLEGKGQTE